MENTVANIIGIGLLSPAGVDAETSWQALLRGERSLCPLRLFEAASRADLPVAEVHGLELEEEVPRTHGLALAAARQALADAAELLPAAPDAVVLGGTTGGIPTTERLIRDGIEDASRYRWHGAGTVADFVAAEIGCVGSTLTVATACSSGAVALKIALELIRSGQAETVLAGGVDALCRLTLHGFSMLKVVDQRGARPLDAERAGMTVGEGAAMLVLRGSAQPLTGARAVLRGGGLSCDAFHPSSPQPEGLGALAAMKRALADAGLSAAELDGVHLHGTGTKDNDASESKALRALFGEEVQLPPHSSIKGAFGHAVGAAGAVGAVISTLSLRDGVIPPNVGCERVDSALGLDPTLQPCPVADMGAIMANSFGFGGNNAALVITRSDEVREALSPSRPVTQFAVVDAACVSGAGLSDASLERLAQPGATLAGKLDPKAVVEKLPLRRVRRLKRLSRIALALAAELGEIEGAAVDSIMTGTAWGALSETHDFLERLFESGETSSSPTDFVGSVHNAVGGQLAMWFDARGANVTTTRGARSFADALRLATLFSPRDGGRTLVVGVDEHHDVLTPRLSPASREQVPADGGGALLLEPAGETESALSLQPFFYGSRLSPSEPAGAVAELASALVDAAAGAVSQVWYGLPDEEEAMFGGQLPELESAFSGARFRDYRALVGHFAAAPALATALAARSLLATPGGPIVVIELGRQLNAYLLTR